jgi:hypothetical protein
MAGDAEAAEQIAEDQPEAHRRRRRRVLGGVLIAVVLIAGLVVGLVLALGSSSPARPTLASYFPHRPMLAQGTGNARVRLPEVAGQVSVTLVCRDSSRVSVRFTRHGHYECAFSTGCRNGIGTDTLQRRVPWPDEATVTSNARGGQWALFAGRVDHIRQR